MKNTLNMYVEKRIMGQKKCNLRDNYKGKGSLEVYNGTHEKEMAAMHYSMPWRFPYLIGTGRSTINHS